MQGDLDAVLKLIAATIFADKHIYQCEIECFTQAVRDIKIVKKLEPKISEARLLSWYEINKEAIENELNSPFFKDWFYELLDQLRNIPEKQSILDVMHKIARSDGIVHYSERALMTLADRHWSQEATA